MDKKFHLTSLNIVRGIAVVLMIITHVWIVFFWDAQSQVGSAFSFLGGYLSFSIFLFVSGFLLGFKYKEIKVSKIVIRAVILLATYFALGAVYIYTHKLNIGYIFTSPVYLQEYLLTLAIMPFLGYFAVRSVRFFKFLKNILRHPVGIAVLFIFGIISVLLGKYSAQSELSVWPLNIIFGSASVHVFPVISYGVIYFIGGWLGWAKREDSAKDFWRELTIISIVSLAIACIAIPVENISFSLSSLDSIRWPPTLFFVFSSLFMGLLLLIIALKTQRFESNPFSKTVSFLGKNSLLLVVVHLLIIFFAEPYILEIKAQQEQNKIPIVTDSERFLIDMETYTSGWKFTETKLAIIKSITPISVGKKSIKIVPKDIQSSLSGHDVAIYVKKIDGEYSKTEHVVALQKDDSYFVIFDVTDSIQEIIVGFDDVVTVPAAEHISKGLSQALGDAETLQVIDKDFLGWEFKPLSLSGTKWVLSRDIQRPYDYHIYLPFSCSQLEMLKRDGGNWHISQNGIEVEGFGKCNNLNDIDDQIDGAASSLNFPVEMKNLSEDALVEIFIVLKDGEKEVSLAATRKIAITEPLFVIWSLDWEGFSVPQAHLDMIQSIRNRFGLRIAHMINPRAWNSTSVSRSNANNQIAYIKDKIDKYSDESALHLHMFKDMLEKAGVTPSQNSGWGNRSDGYDIPLSEYSYEDTKKLINWAKAEVTKKGFPEPKTFRAGGWFIDMDNIRALKDTGFLVDTSGRTKYTSRYFGTGPVLQGLWTLSETEQPYWISKTNQNKGVTSKNEGIGILEMPNNGADSWAYSDVQMIDRFKKNYTSSTVKTPLVMTYLSHPEYFNKEGPKIEKVLEYIHYFSQNNESGPVVYTTFVDYYNYLTQK